MFDGIVIALVPLFIGYLIKLSNKTWLNGINQSLSLIVYLILFIMGIELAQLDDLMANLTTIIASTLILFICTFGMNVLFLLVIDIFLPWRSNHSYSQPVTSRFKMILESLRICLAIILGFLCGLIPLSIWQYNDLATKVILVILLILVGIQLRSNNMTIKQILINKIGMMTTIVVTLSALLGGLIASYALNLSIKTGLAMSSGFGWYSLSGVLMSEAQGPIIGGITFLNDIMRELCAIVLIPSLIKRFKLTALGICGATSMDFTLPMLQKGGGMMMVPPAIVQGFLLTLLMPILMTLLNYYF